jgi:hypothetical protein
MPERFQVLVRVVRADTQVTVRWDGPDRIMITTDDYRGNFVLSEDLRQFDHRLAERAFLTLETPLGSLHAEPFGDSGERLTLTLSAMTREDPPLFFYYSGGRIHSLPSAGRGGSGTP